MYIVRIQLFRERLSEKVHATVSKGVVGGFYHFFSKKFQRMARKAMDVCFRVLKESNKKGFDSYSVRNKCIDHIPYYLSGLLRALFFRQRFILHFCLKGTRLL